MKPSQKAIEAAVAKFSSLRHMPTYHHMIRPAIEAFIAIDVDPLIEAKDKEIERLQWLLAAQRVENERLKAEHLSNCLFHRCKNHRSVPQLNKNEFSGSECGACIQEHLEFGMGQRISELEAENERLAHLVEIYVPIMEQKRGEFE